MSKQNKTKKYRVLKYIGFAVLLIVFFNMANPFPREYSGQVSLENNSVSSGFQIANAQAPPPPTAADVGVGAQKDVLTCGKWWNLTCWIVGGILYSAWFVTAMLAKFAAFILDFFIGYSLDDKSFRSVFVVEGWKVTRDLANLVFIFVLVFAAIKTVIEGLSDAVKKTIKNVIIVALLINFSLFMVRVVVDSTNILARIFYNQIEVTGTLGDSVPGTKPVSIALVDKFSPQKLILDPDTAKQMNPGENLGYFSLIMVLAIYLNITMFTVFFSVGIFFLGRVIGLWIAMIFAPFAFISLTLPAKVRASMQDWGWEKWLSSMTGMAIMAPIFTFFLYLIILFTDIGGLLSAPEGSTTTIKIMAIVIPFLIIVALLKKAKTLTSQYAGEIGTQLAAAVGKVAGVAAVAATGGAALAGGAVMAGGKLGALAGKGMGKLGEKVGGGFGARLKTYGAGFEKYGKKAAAAPQKIGAAMRETALGRGIGTTFGVAGKLAGKGLAAAGIPGLEKLGGVLTAGTGFLKPGAALAGAMGMKPEELGALGRMGYRDKKERKADKMRRENERREGIQYKMSDAEDEETKEKSEKKQKKYDKKVADAKSKDPTLTPEQIKEKYGERPKIYNTTAERNDDVMRQEIEKLKNGNQADQKLAEKLEKEANELDRLRDDKIRNEEKLDKIDTHMTEIVEKLQRGGKSITGEEGKKNINLEANERALPLRADIQENKAKIKTAIRNKKWSVAANLESENDQLEKDVKLLGNIVEEKSNTAGRIGDLSKKIKTAEKEQKGEEE